MWLAYETTKCAVRKYYLWLLLLMQTNYSNCMINIKKDFPNLIANDTCFILITLPLERQRDNNDE